MGYSEFDRALLEAWHRAREACKEDPARLGEILRRRGMAVYRRPLRSWSLVLRAGDKRIEDEGERGVVRVDAGRVRAWCAPVRIDYPGVSLDEAAGLFGVNRTTVSRWASPRVEGVEGGKGVTWWQAVQGQKRGVDDGSRFAGPGSHRVVGRRLMLEYEVNRANPKRGVARVWTPSADGVDPGGEVWAGAWGRLRAGLCEQVSGDFVQVLQRVERGLGAGGAGARGPASRVRQWVCPAGDGGCGRLVYKVYLPMPAWTLGRVMGEASAGLVDDTGRWGAGDGFVCHRCAGLLYESAERGSSPGRRVCGARRRVDVLGRLVTRMSGGVLAGGSVFTAS